jgi:eukaryotic-like serine/threonine-protein kinase
MSTSVRYQPLRLLANGGMAELYLARVVGAELFEKLVVVKRVLPAQAGDPDVMARLVNEAKILAHLSHPNIVQILDLARDRDQLFIVMEYVDGADLRQILGRFAELGRRVPLGFACRVAADALAGLGYAHRRCSLDGKPLGLVHRDVSPANVMVSHEGGVKLLDFGIARSRLQVTQARELKGKISYMSPEQVELRALDARSDLFAVGVILWEMVEGRPLFRREDVDQTVTAVRDCVVPAWSVAEAPARLEALVRRALARAPDERPADADQMREELEALIREQRWPADALTVRRTMRELFGEPQPAALAPLADAPTLIIEREAPITLATMPTLPILLSDEPTVVCDDTLVLSTTTPPTGALPPARPVSDPTLVLKRESGRLRRAGWLVVAALILFGLSLALTWMVVVGRAR